MTGDDQESAVARSVDILTNLGLTEYSARTYVGLLRLGTGTAREVSNISDVPRTKVYEEIERLEDRGLVDVQNGTPKRFVPLTRKATTERFRREYKRNVNTLSATLDELEVRDTADNSEGVWFASGTEAIEDRLQLFLESANESVRFFSDPAYLSDSVLSQLLAADSRGVELTFGAIGDTIDRRLERRFESADHVHLQMGETNTQPSRLVLVDESVALVGTNGHDDPLNEEAIWSTDPHNALVVLVQTIFTAD
ncbi:TrmB family transcriptional regulator [Haloarchaeobius sp. DT45]|uniref:TrmB family transcriptional regulator n=1 Tax=Haloarchaeobius sp. DT45 TaxID=3446116 RepID=UPI003F6C77C1